MGRLPSFVIIGSMKCGTTSLANYLSFHPDVAISRPMEPNFFAEPGTWNRGVDWYMNLFSSNTAAAGEASTSYTMQPERVNASSRMCKTIPEARLIYIVRDPIERMRSMYRHRADKYQNPYRSLTEAIERDPSYLSISDYGRQLEPYLEKFSSERILVVTTDELAASPRNLLQRAFRHIAVDASFKVSATNLYNVGANKHRLSSFGFRAARIMVASGIMNRVPHLARQRAKSMLSRRIDEEELTLTDDFERSIRLDLSTRYGVVRGLVDQSGGQIPSWLAGRGDPR